LPDHRLHTLILLAAAGAVTAALPGRAVADSAPRIGIAVAVKVNLDSAEVEELSAAFGRALHQKLVVDVVAGREANRRLPNEGVSESCVVDAACVKDTAQRLTADQLLFLVAVRVGNRIQVDSTWVDPATGKTASRPKVVMVRLDEAEERFAESASLILPEVSVRPVAAAPIDGDAAVAMQIRTTPRHFTTATWVTAGIGAAALGTGIGFAVVTRNQYTGCEDRPDERPCSASERNAVHRNGTIADIAFGAAAASAIVVGLLYYSSGGDIERIPVAARSLRFQVDGQGGAFVAVEGHL
jgi:hypothetical protein